MFRLKLKIRQKSFVGRTPPRPAGGAYSAAPDSLAGLRGKRMERRGGEEEYALDLQLTGDHLCG